MTRTRAIPAPTAAAEHPADRAIRLRDRAGLPGDQHAAYNAMLAGFARYEAGDDDGAREALQAVGLQSPFLEWKLLLRGLIAYSAGDDTRAVENWQRLTSDRLPARLAAPVRAAIDRRFAAAQPAATAAVLRKQFEALAADDVTDALRGLRGDLSRDRPLTAAFRKVEPLVPRLRQQSPVLATRLANCFYRAILHHGESGDLVRFRKLFGPPADDPDFHRLEAQVYEGNGNDEEAARHWAAYEAWLATGPPAWPAGAARRARAMILHRLGALAAEQDDDPHRELREAMSAFFAPDRLRRRTQPPADPAAFWRKAAALAPDWDAPARSLFERLAENGQTKEAEAVARKLLAHNPTAIPVMDALAGLLARTSRAADALALRTTALAANPLDPRLRVQAAYGYLAAARRLAIDGRPADAEATLTTGEALCTEHTPTGYFALRSVLARKLKRPADADEYRAKADAVRGGRLAATLFVAVDSALLKLKPVDRKPAEQALATAFAGPAAPLEANLLYAAWDQYFLEGITYRGQKSQEKKVHDVVLRTPASDAPVADFENLARAIEFRNEWKLVAKLAAPLREKFPDNPVFPLLLAEAEFEKAGGFPMPYRVTALLKAAERAAERSREPRHRDLLDRIRVLQQRVGRPPDFGGLFSGM